MLGFIFGTVCLIALVKMVSRHGCHRHGPLGWAGHGCGHGYGYGPGHGPDFGYGEGYGRGGRGMGWRGRGPARWFLRSLFERLQTTPGQERAILAALEELSDNRAAIRDEVQRTRADVARVVGSGLVDDAALEETFASHDRALARVRVSLVEALKKVTEALDERQRKELAAWIEGGRFGGGPFWGNPYRGMWA